eukprot:3081559-Alexandrium_andersonii.AAC.1
MKVRSRGSVTTGPKRRCVRVPSGCAGVGTTMATPHPAGRRLPRTAVGPRPLAKSQSTGRRGAGAGPPGAP